MRVCLEPNCPTLVERGRCPKHSREKVRTYDRWRGTATARGYGSRWSRFRAHFLAEYCFCGDRAPGAPQTGDSVCARDGLLVAATVADHIVPVLGPNDPSFFELTALQALCSRCHDGKRGRESAAARRLSR
jgi:5-methylcytosine-specific restriction protein A